MIGRPCQLLLYLVLLSTVACIGPGLLPPPGSELDLVMDDPGETLPLPYFVEESEDDWVELTSGEWLRGEILSLTRGTLEFDSEELDELNLDWDDVRRVHTKRTFNVLLENRAMVAGNLDVQGERVRVTGEEGALDFRRDDVQRVVVGANGELGRWSGKLDVGFTARRGNTDQTDTSLGFSARRRTTATRLDLKLDTIESTIDGSRVASNQRFQEQFDMFVTSRLFLTPISLEVFRDHFQNIDRRITPSLGLGYLFMDESQVEWSGRLGAGYRWTRFDSVPAGEDPTSEEAVAIVSTAVEADLTEKLELEAEYSAQISFDSLDGSQQDAGLDLIYDVWGDMDAILGFSWTHVGQPATDADGNTPEADDFRLTIGLSWDF